MFNIYRRVKTPCQKAQKAPCQIATAWLKNHSAIFPISPTGTGFSSILIKWLWVTARSHSQLKMSDQHCLVYTIFNTAGENVSFCRKCAELPTNLFTFTIELNFCVWLWMGYILQIFSTPLGMLDIKKLGLLRNNFPHFSDSHTVCDVNNIWSKALYAITFCIAEILKKLPHKTVNLTDFNNLLNKTNS